MNGSKTYIVAGLIVVYAIASVYFKQMTYDQAVAWVLGSGAIAALRSAIKKLQPTA